MREFNADLIRHLSDEQQPEPRAGDDLWRLFVTPDVSPGVAAVPAAARCALLGFLCVRTAAAFGAQHAGAHQRDGVRRGDK